jgi:hypothetical protein
VNPNLSSTKPINPNAHCPGCEVEWTGDAACWLCGSPGVTGHAKLRQAYEHIAEEAA